MRTGEKIVDIGFEIRSKIISHRTGRPTAMRKDVLEGPMVNGEIRPDIHNQLDVWNMVLESGVSAHTSNTHARDVRRRIVFLDETIPPSEPGTFGNVELAKLAIRDDLKLGITIDQLHLARDVIVGERGLNIAYQVIQDYVGKGRDTELLRSQKVETINLEPVTFRDALIQEYSSVLKMTPEQIQLIISQPEAPTEPKRRRQKSRQPRK